MVAAALNLTAIIAAVAAAVFWIVCLVNWDGDCSCDETQCGSCPFPCEKHNNKMR